MKKALVKFLDDQIDLPWLLESIDNIVINKVIDSAVEHYNVYIGHDWTEIVKKYKYGDGAVIG